MSSIFAEVTFVIVLASIVAIIFRLLHQPAILAYILTGILLGPLHIFEIRSTEMLQTLAELGITLLLFMVGLELKFSELRSVGKIAIITGISQIVFTSLIGYFLSLALGFSSLSSIYIAIALTFSSTIIIVKLLSDKKDLNSLYGKISVGFLLVQDFVAILALIFLSGFGTPGGAASFFDFGLVIFKGTMLFIAILIASKSILPRLIDKLSHSQEVLFLFSIAWAFAMSALVSSPLVGFSIEIGGFLAGLSLANSTENFQIVSKVRALRDFFITIFFVLLGMKMTFGNIDAILTPAVILSAFVLIGNPIIMMIILGALGYRKRTSFLAGLTVAQISEFSLILIFLGYKIGHVSNDVISLVTLIGVITFAASSYMILNGNALYKVLKPFLSVFEKKEALAEEQKSFGELKDHVVLVGLNRSGSSIFETLQEEGKQVVVVDFDPDVIKKLEKANVSAIFGDIVDSDIQERVSLNSAKLVISTMADFEDNSLLMQSLKHNKNGAKIIVMAQDAQDAKMLYKRGADYVVVPHIAAGKHLAKIIAENRLEHMEKLKEKDS